MDVFHVDGGVHPDLSTGLRLEAFAEGRIHARFPTLAERINALEADIESLSDEALRAKTFTERLEMVLEANRTMRLLITGHLRTYHGDWTDERIAAEVARRMLRESN